MDDILEFNGVRYVSPDRALHKYGYNKVRINELARFGAVDAKLVDRVWFIREQDLQRLFEQERAAQLAKEAQQRTRVQVRDGEEDEDIDQGPMTYAKRLAAAKHRPRATSKDGSVVVPVDAVRTATHGVSDEADVVDDAVTMTRSSYALEAEEARRELLPPLRPRPVDPERKRVQDQLLGSMDVRYGEGRAIRYSHDEEPRPVRRTERPPVARRRPAPRTPRTRRAAAPSQVRQAQPQARQAPSRVRVVESGGMHAAHGTRTPKRNTGSGARKGRHILVRLLLLCGMLLMVAFILFFGIVMYEEFL